MRINLHFVQEDLPEFGFDGQVIDPPSVARCRTAQMAKRLPPRLNEEVIYLVDAAALPATPPPKTRASIICFGEPPASWRDAAVNLLYTANPLCREDVMNTIVSLIDHYNRWEEDLVATVDLGLPFETIGMRAAPLFDNPLIAQDVSYRPLFFALPPSPAAKDPAAERLRVYRTVIYEPHVSSDGLAVPGNMATTFNQNPEFAKLEHARDPVVFSGDTWAKLSSHALSFRSLLFNCHADDGIRARVIVDEVIHPLRKKDHVLIQALGACVTKALRTRGVGDARQSSRFVRLCDRLIAREAVSEGRLERGLEGVGWRAEDRYFCALLREEEIDHRFSAIVQVASGLTAHTPSRQHCFADGRAVVICNLSESGRNRNEEIELLHEELADMSATASFSASFQGFKHLGLYYRQALKTERLGRSARPSDRFYRFEDFALVFALSQCVRDFPTEAVVPDSVKELIAADREHGTHDALVLKTFLDNDRNVAHTARALYLHRNTLLYRLQKIQQETSLALDDPDTRLATHIALRLLRVSKDAPYGR